MNGESGQTVMQYTLIVALISLPMMLAFIGLFEDLVGLFWSRVEAFAP